MLRGHVQSVWNTIEKFHHDPEGYVKSSEAREDDSPDKLLKLINCLFAKLTGQNNEKLKRGKEM